ncbi:hypothetical protein ACH4GK_38865 [Streptomyces rimosus]|uniref:hypothetical protein n=1 Tax=Streptomyces rimosus TaxID=1927 RepID=UPI000A8FFA56|nr:hypothetical protein [Streptomyces rimosus]
MDDSGTPPATEARLPPVLEALAAREPLFHRPEYGTARADFERMTAPDFWEVGASGRRYGRAHVLDVLEERFSRPVAEEREVPHHRGTAVQAAAKATA